MQVIVADLAMNTNGTLRFRDSPIERCIELDGTSIAAADDMKSYLPL